MRKTSEGVALLLDAATSAMRAGAGLNLLVTHDAILVVLVAHLYGVQVDEIIWPDYLDGLVLWAGTGNFSDSRGEVSSRVRTQPAVRDMALDRRMPRGVAEYLCGFLYAVCLPLAPLPPACSPRIRWRPASPGDVPAYFRQDAQSNAPARCLRRTCGPPPRSCGARIASIQALHHVVYVGPRPRV